jgi:hypothetical protein
MIYYPKGFSSTPFSTACVSLKIRHMIKKVITGGQTGVDRAALSELMRRFYEHYKPLPEAKNKL